MTKATDTIQLRGICQCCGREQAVRNGLMAKHGYTVEDGWFNGVCSGQHHAPMESDRTITDKLVVDLRRQCDEFDELASDYEAGKKHPAMIRKAVRRPGEPEQIAWAQGSEAEKRSALDAAVWKVRRHAERGRQIAETLESLADKYHGHELRAVTKPEKAAPIKIGERRRLGSGSEAKVTRVDGARVYWIIEGTTRKGWVGTQAWRRLDVV